MINPPKSYYDNLRRIIYDRCKCDGIVRDIESPKALRLVFDDIANVPVADASNISDWNTFFDLPNLGGVFTSVEIDSNEVRLFGGSNIETRFQLFAVNGHLLEIWDEAECIVTLGDETFAGSIAPSVLQKAYFPGVTKTLVTNETTYGVFGSCYDLTYAYLPKCVNLAGSTFYDCANLPNSGLTLPFDEITELGYYTFEYNAALSEIGFPNVTQVGEHCFEGCVALTTINLPNLTTAGNGCFNYCPLLTTVNLPNLTTAGDYCFSVCAALTTIDLPNLTTAGYNCFSNCMALTTIDLPNLTTAGDYCFKNCIALTTVDLPSCTNLGTTTGNDNVFNSISGNNIALTVPSALMTCNIGLPDGDIQYLQSNNTVTVITV